MSFVSSSGGRGLGKSVRTQTPWEILKRCLLALCGRFLFSCWKLQSDNVFEETLFLNGGWHWCFPRGPHKPEAPRLKTYAEMIFSRGSGGSPTVSCVWWDSRSVQAYSFRGKGEGEREKGEMRKWANSKGKGTANKIIPFSLYKVYDACCHLFEKFIHRPQNEQPRQGCISVTFVFPICDPRPGSAGPVSGYLMPSHCSQYIRFPDMLQVDGLWVLKYQC